MPFVSFTTAPTSVRRTIKETSLLGTLAARTLRSNSAMPMTANVAEAPNLMTSHFPFNVFHSDLHFIASQIAGIMGKLHMTSIMAFGVIDTSVSITMVI